MRFGINIDNRQPLEGAPVILGHMIANDKNRGLDIALNPAWRDTVTHMIVVTSFMDGAPSNVIQSTINVTQNVYDAALKKLAPESGAYFNEVSYLNISYI